MGATGDKHNADREEGDPVRVYGVDFSAAATDAGRKTWIASGRVDPQRDRLMVTGLRPLTAVTGLDTACREAALPALARWLRERDETAVIGLDFPFGLPQFIGEETGNESWRSLINRFPESIGVDGSSEGDGGGSNDPVRTFAERCVGLTERHGGGTYDKRRTDAAVGARSPYGFIADTITFYGIRDVLAAVLDEVRFAPMDRTDEAWRPDVPAGPTAVETYPAAVLDRFGLHRTRYKGSGDEESARRRENAEGLAEAADVIYKSKAAATETMVSNAGGDALDAVVACVGAFTAWKYGYRTDTDAFDDPDAVALEGYIYD